MGVVSLSIAISCLVLPIVSQGDYGLFKQAIDLQWAQ